MTASLFVPLAAIAAAVAASPGPADDSPFPAWLDTRTIGAEAWRKSHPEWDGRGVAIAVLDTGVDMGVSGLDRLPGGGVKVVEARDFTGEAVVECQPASVEQGEDGKPVWRAGDTWVRGVDSLPDLPKGAPVFVGSLDESRFRNSGVADFNGNGRTDDRFPFVLYRSAAGEWVAVVDRAGDHDLAGDAPVRDYSKGHGYLELSGHDPARAVAPIHIALHIDASDDGPKKVEFHVPNGSHGTHVAGIAAGWRIDGRDGYDGVAPGAVVLSLKVGTNALSGGSSVTDSMKHALEFAGRWSREHGTPVVANLSYGIGSEGRSDIDRTIDRFCEENPTVVVVISAGNQGPGLSTVSTPGTAVHALTVGAVYTPALARDLMGATVQGVRVFQYSSRGGEVDKPDVVAPGIAASTVPYWAKGDVMRGTSMAAPEVTGAAALLVSAIAGRKDSPAWSSGMVRRAMRAGAAPIAGYGPLDQGGGLVDVQHAWDALSGALGNQPAAALQGVEASTPAPTAGGSHQGRGSFWRTGGWAPDEARPVTVTLKPRLATAAPGKTRADFHEEFRLSADASWVHVSKGSLYLRGDGEATFELWVDQKAIAAPGVHVATVRGTGRAGMAFQVPVTVMTPYRPEVIQGIPTVRLRGLKLAASDLLRFPLLPPPGTVTMEVVASPVRDRKASVFLYLFDSRGRHIPLRQPMVSSENADRAEVTLTEWDLLDPGQLELDLHALPNARFASEVDVDVRFFALAADPVRSFQSEPGMPPRAHVEVANRMDAPFAGKVTGAISGCERAFTRSLPDTLRETFHMSREVQAVEFELTMSADDYARFTDVAVAVLDKDGKALAREGFQSRRLRFTFRNPDPAAGEADFTLEVVAGRAAAGGPQASADFAMRFQWKDAVALSGSPPNGGTKVEAYPAVRTPVEVKAASTPRACGQGSSWYGELDFVSERDGKTWLSLPVKVKGM